jgi:hypothetical protein
MLSLLLSGCTGLTEKQALQCANAAGKAAGYDLRRYKPTIHYNFTEADDTWVVFYNPIAKLVTTGDFFTVYVPNHGGSAEVDYGR